MVERVGADMLGAQDSLQSISLAELIRRLLCACLVRSGLQKGPAERGHVKNRQKVFDTFRQISRSAKNVKNRQKASKKFLTLFDKFRAAPFFRPLLGGSDVRQVYIDLRSQYI